jgi:hypothetical protein
MGNTKWEFKKSGSSNPLITGETDSTSDTITIPGENLEKGTYIFTIYDASNPSCSVSTSVVVTCECDGVLPPDFVIQPPLKQCDEYGTGRGPCLNHTATATTPYEVSYNPGDCYKIIGVDVGDSGLITADGFTANSIKFTCNQGSAGWGVEHVNVKLEHKTKGTYVSPSLPIEINYISECATEPCPDIYDEDGRLMDETKNLYGDEADEVNHVLRCEVGSCYSIHSIDTHDDDKVIIFETGAMIGVTLLPKPSVSEGKITFNFAFKDSLDRIECSKDVDILWQNLPCSDISCPEFHKSVVNHSSTATRTYECYLYASCWEMLEDTFTVVGGSEKVSATYDINTQTHKHTVYITCQPGDSSIKANVKVSFKKDDVIEERVIRIFYV